MTIFNAGDKVTVKTNREWWFSAVIHAGHQEPYVVTGIIDCEPEEDSTHAPHSQVLRLVDANGLSAGRASGYWFDETVKP